MACLNCRRLKIRCNGPTPCGRCQRLKLVCADGKRASGGSGPTQPSRRMVDTHTPNSRTSETGSSPLSARRPNPLHQLLNPEGPPITPPFSTFVYPTVPTHEETANVAVPACARRLPELLDPIAAGVMPEELARELFNFFQSVQENQSLVLANFDGVRRESTYLLCSILCVAYHNETVLAEQSVLHGITNMALNGLAASILLRPKSTSDVVATMLLALWEVDWNVGGGPSSYLALGHALRIARRLNLHNAAPFTNEWAIFTELNTYDRLYTSGYGRPMTTGDKHPSAKLSTDLLTQPVPHLYTGVLARSELVHTLRRAVDWARDNPTSADVFAKLNDELDDWNFKWTSPTSRFRTSWGQDLVWTTVLSHHVRLYLNMVPSHGSGGPSHETKAGRLALTAAAAIVDLFQQHATQGTKLRLAPALGGSILAYATLCLSSSALGESSDESRNPLLDEYYNRGMEILRSGVVNQGITTLRYAGTIEAHLRKEGGGEQALMPTFNIFDFGAYFDVEQGDQIQSMTGEYIL